MTDPAYNLVFHEICTNPCARTPAPGRHIAVAPPAHPAPTLRDAHEPLSLHPERHDPRRSYSTIPCIENTRCAPRGQQNPPVPGAGAQRNARDSSSYAVRARLRPSACAPRDHHRPAVVVTIGIKVSSSHPRFHRSRRINLTRQNEPASSAARRATHGSGCRWRRAWATPVAQAVQKRDDHHRRSSNPGSVGS